MFNRTTPGAAVVVLALLACACSTLEPPKVTVVAVRLDRVLQARAQFGIDVALANPNSTDIEVTALDAALSIEDQRVAEATLAQPVRIPAGGTATAELVASAGMEAILRATTAAIMRGATAPPGQSPVLRYAIEGTAVLSGGLRVPFARSGELGSRAGGGGR